MQPVPSRFPLIAPGDPPPFRVVNPQGRAPVLLVCDHASRAFPRHMGSLGLDKPMLDLHIAYDIGSQDVCLQLAARLDAPAVLAGYSRLIVDCNRQLYDETCFPRISDGVAVPGNLELSDMDKWLRVRSFYWPYHHAISAQLEDFRRRGVTPAMISVHSCTPVFDRVVRPWEFGVLWDQDPRLAVPLIDRLRAVEGVHVGDNEPYSGRHPHDFTIDYHAEPEGLPHIGLEVRQDLIADADGVRYWGGVLGDALADVLDDDSLYAPWQPRA